jgi:hypothetical protein
MHQLGLCSDRCLFGCIPALLGSLQLRLEVTILDG